MRQKFFPKNLALKKNYFGICRRLIGPDPIMPANKKKVIKSLENLTEELMEVVREQYPTGYESSITRITNAKREPIFVFPIETEDATILVKVPVTKNSDGEYDVESTPDPEADNSGNDDDYGSEDGGGYTRSNDDDYDDEGGGGRKNREASYDPDFDG